ncbi:Transcription termination/antitermination protein NusG [Buchnera aphidicola (Phyllaphis fagi)]|uniref:transcription termination/antitermination protein NusG n=1 Tax=Buchnera aphidicola TaxID=9 RepID=UPI0034638622
MYDDHKTHWYVVQVFSGFENRIVQTLKKRIIIEKMEKLFQKILVPTEQIIEKKNGKRKESKFNFFPGYILLKMYINEKSWHLVRNIPKVIGFIGGTSEQPLHISNQEVKKVIYQLSQIRNKSRPKILFEAGEKIRVKDGPFSDFHGVVETMDYDKNRLKVSVSIFGRPTPVELDFNQVEKNV